MLLNCGLEKILENPLDCKEIQPVHPKEDKSSVFIGRTDVEAETSILWVGRLHLECINDTILMYAAKSLQSCPTLCDPIGGSPPGSPFPGIL